MMTLPEALLISAAIVGLVCYPTYRLLDWCDRRGLDGAMVRGPAKGAVMTYADYARLIEPYAPWAILAAVAVQVAWMLSVGGKAERNEWEVRYLRQRVDDALNLAGDAYRLAAERREEPPR